MLEDGHLAMRGNVRRRIYEHAQGVRHVPVHAQQLSRDFEAVVVVVFGGTEIHCRILPGIGDQYRDDSVESRFQHLETEAVVSPQQILAHEGEDRHDVREHGFGRHFSRHVDDVQSVSVTLTRGVWGPDALDDDFDVEFGGNEQFQSVFIFGAKSGENRADCGEAEVSAVGAAVCAYVCVWRRIKRITVEMLVAKRVIFGC